MVYDINVGRDKWGRIIGAKDDEIAIQVEEKLRKLGYKVPKGSYSDWLYGGRQFEKFDKIMIKFLGKKAYDEMDMLARLDAYLLYKLGLGPKSAGGIVFK